MDTLAIVKRIEMRLSELGMSKAEFYKKTGISSASFSQWRSGLYKPSEKKLITAAECLGISLDYLVTGTINDGATYLVAGINVYRSVDPNKIKEKISDIDPESYRIVYDVPGLMITVDNDSPISQEEIDKLVKSYQYDLQAKKEQPIVIDGLSFDNVSKEDIETIKAYLALPEEQRRALAVILGIVE